MIEAHHAVNQKKLTFADFLQALAVILVISCVLTPQVKRLFLVLAPHAAFFEKLAEYELHRILSRVVMVVGVVYLVCMRKKLFQKDGPFVSLKGTRRDVKLFWLAFAAGVVSLVMHVVCSVWFGARALDFDGFTWYGLARKMVRGLCGAAAIGIIEEFFFRGLLFGALAKRFSVKRAVIISSAVYACMHFFRPKDISIADETAFWSGFAVLGQIITPFLTSEFLVESVGLFLVGSCLALGYHYTRSLYFAAGLHAGWVWVIKVDGFIVDRTIESQIKWWGSSQMVGGTLTWLLLAVILLLIHLTLSPRRSVHNG